MVPVIFSLTVLTVILFIAFMFRTPSKKEIKKFVDKTNEKNIWSKLGFWPLKKKIKYFIYFAIYIILIIILAAVFYVNGISLI